MESNDLLLIHGVRQIAKAINKPERATYHLLQTGRLPGAFKLNEGVTCPWSLDLSVFRAAIREKQEAANAPAT